MPSNFPLITTPDLALNLQTWLSYIQKRPPITCFSLKIQKYKATISKLMVNYQLCVNRNVDSLSQNHQHTQQSAKLLFIIHSENLHDAFNCANFLLFSALFLLVIYRCLPYTLYLKLIRKFTGNRTFILNSIRKLLICFRVSSMTTPANFISIISKTNQ